MRRGNSLQNCLTWFDSKTKLINSAVNAPIVQRKDMGLLNPELGFESLWGYHKIESPIGKNL